MLLLATGIRDGRISPPRQWRLPRRPGSIVILAVFTLVYTVLLTIIASTQGIDPLRQRLLAPVYIPLLFIVALVLDRLFQYDAQGKPWGTLAFISNIFLLERLFRKGVMPGTVTLILMAGLVFWLWLQADLYTYRFQRNVEEGWGFSSRQWVESETIQQVKVLSLQSPPVTNEHRALYIQTGLPEKYCRLSFQPPDNFLNLSPCYLGDSDDIYIAWFYGQRVREYTYDAAYLRALPWLETVADLDDGVIFKVNKAYANDADR